MPTFLTKKSVSESVLNVLWFMEKVLDLALWIKGMVLAMHVVTAMLLGFAVLVWTTESESGGADHLWFAAIGIAFGLIVERLRRKIWRLVDEASEENPEFFHAGRYFRAQIESRTTWGDWPTRN